jgi:serine/threonine protein kinase
MDLGPGTRLGAYEIVSPLGAGGMGEVYLAKDVELEAIVERCFSKGAKDRYESTEDLAEELRKVPETSSADERRPGTSSATVDSIAVLPFRNLSGDPVRIEGALCRVW